MLPLPIMPPLNIVPVAIPPPNSSNSKTATTMAMTKGVFPVEFMICVSFARLNLELDSARRVASTVITLCNAVPRLRRWSHYLLSESA